MNHVKRLVHTGALILQAGAFAGAVGFMLGKTFRMIDPVKGGEFYAKTAAISILTASIISDFLKDKMMRHKSGMVTFMGMTVVSLGSYFYHKEFPLIHAINATVLGFLGILGVAMLTVHLTKKSPRKI